jgi:ATP-dependent exoDNAse (exonuclease V) beta subunit
MSHISYSEFKNWDFCPFYHKLTYIDKLRIFEGNEYTAFGTSLHLVCEELTKDKNVDYKKIFLESFAEEVAKISIQENRKNLVEDMKAQGVFLASIVIDNLNTTFPGWSLISCEEKLYEKIENVYAEYDFKGFVDLVLKTPDGKYHIIDWKSCSWGWDLKRKTDKIQTYQLTYYKNFFSQKHNIEPEKIETYFGLLKRTAKKDHVEIFRVSSGEKKIKNALNILQKAVYNIHQGNHPKNKLNCGKCEFRRTEHCP